MAEQEVKSDRENNKEREEEGGGGGDANEEINVENNGNLERDSSTVLAGLNLVMILSSLSLSDEECLNFEEIEDRGSGNSDQKGKICGPRSNLPAKRRGGNGFRAAERQMSKVQTKIKDCRHCRKM